MDAEPNTRSGQSDALRSAPIAKRVLGPILAGLILDSVDFMTLGPVGFYTGMLAGGAVGYWLAPDLGFPARARLWAAALAGIYCTLPFTGFLPLATIAAGIASFVLREGDPGGSASVDPQKVIDVEFESRSEPLSSDTKATETTKSPGT